jgi:hypothetical protein
MRRQDPGLGVRRQRIAKRRPELAEAADAARRQCGTAKGRGCDPPGV